MFETPEEEDTQPVQINEFVDENDIPAEPTNEEVKLQQPEAKKPEL